MRLSFPSVKLFLSLGIYRRVNLSKHTDRYDSVKRRRHINNSINNVYSQSPQSDAKNLTIHLDSVLLSQIKAAV